MQSLRRLPLLLVLMAVGPRLGAEDLLHGSWWSLHGQATVVAQGHPAFHSPYSGSHSASSDSDGATTVTTTLSALARPWSGAQLRVDPELSAGGGFPGGPGIAGYPNDEVAHVGTRAPRVYLARLHIRQYWSAPAPITLTAGRMSATDLFDNNSFSHDPRAQFLNWGLAANAAWDYPADSRGYTWGAAFEVAPDSWSFRLGSFLEPQEANGAHLETRISREHSEVAEAERRYRANGEPGTLRLLGFWSHADMGNYRAAIANPPLAPDITTTRQSGNAKWGIGVNWEQALGSRAGVFSRLGWNDGRTETWAFTEVDETASLGFQLKGNAWGRDEDILGFAGLVNGLSADHRAYLAAGGSGFVLGDGALTYGSENILESYYAWHVWALTTLTFDLQEIAHPGYNRDRGPMTAGSLRLHLEF